MNLLKYFMFFLINMKYLPYQHKKEQIFIKVISNPFIF